MRRSAMLDGAVGLSVAVGVCVGATVAVAVALGVLVAVAVGVLVAARVGVHVAVRVLVAVGVAVRVQVGVLVAAGAPLVTVISGSQTGPNWSKIAKTRNRIAIVAAIPFGSFSDMRQAG